MITRRGLLAAAAGGVGVVVLGPPATAEAALRNFHKVRSLNGVYRSATLKGISSSSRKHLAELHLALIVNLEAHADPHGLADRDVHAPIHQAHNHTTRYKHFVTEQRNRDAIGEGLNALAEAEGNVLVHCQKGHTRTGVMVALLDTICGVDSSEMYREYLSVSGTKRSYLRTFLATIVTEYGTVEHFLEVCGVSVETQAIIRTARTVG